MNSLVLTITVLLGLLLVPAIDMKRKRCHKRPTVVECSDPIPRTCANMTISTDQKFVGSTGKLTCSAGHSLKGNDSIKCLEDGTWSPINAICVPNGVIGVRSFSGSIYIFVKNVNGYENAKETCSSMCGTLLEINNQEENRFILSAKEELGIKFPYFGLESKDGISYVWQSGNTTVSNMFNNRNPLDNVSNDIEVGSCFFMVSGGTWYDAPKSICNSIDNEYICESRFD
ncbi:uncharacterized protein LOC134700135 [Mytilus trossulus]|uniref:uncharacterized protein LOC134700135 n=1 Tax=Mytilus trossulus TaxID=6551 RepID=UPI0030079667